MSTLKIHTFLYWNPSLFRASTWLEMSRVWPVWGESSAQWVWEVITAGEWWSRCEGLAWRRELRASAAAVGSVSQSLLPCSGGICAAPVGLVPPCILAQSQHSLCHRKCRPRSARFMRKHSCRPSHLPHLDCLPHFKGFLSWWANDALPGRPATWGQPDHNPDPMSVSHATRSWKECLAWQWKQHHVL